MTPFLLRSRNMKIAMVVPVRPANHGIGKSRQSMKLWGAGEMELPAWERYFQGFWKETIHPEKEVVRAALARTILPHA
jgi:hypothetical protein